MMNIGNQIKNLRTEKRVTQEELANYLQISAQAVSKWETGAATPDISLLPSISTFFGVAIDELFAIPEEEQYNRIENMFFREKRIPQETFQSAVRFLENELAKNPKNLDALIDLAYLYNHRAKSDHDDAALFAMKAIELDGNEKAGWVAYQESMNALCGDEWYDNHYEVIRFCQDVLEKQPDNFRALYTIIENMLGDKRYQDAVPYIEQIEKVAPETGQYHFYMGDVAYGKGNVKEAIELWNEGVEEHSDRWQVYCQRADRMKKLGYIDEAIADYEKCFEMQEAPRITDGLYSLAQVHEAKGDIKAAIKDQEKIIEVLKTDFQTTSGESVDCHKREIERLKKKLK